ncbi:TetR/AcrR family transcriptional regulator [Sneathiella glossodoripedis]|uniref:TetR/AcrR family transcriptional regulator n=1 Tax=Sneathiella glossodoripedis TaxID=418853 RepID=UPI000472051D|nr:TetR/AcrR family transcriptional regulator [Sneathiella glossodoripedis]
MKVAARELVSSNGALDMATLAKKAGLSEGLAYHYFKNRAGVIAAVVDQYFDAFEEAVIDVAFAGDTWQEREKLRVEALVDFYCADPLTPVIYSRLGSEPEVVEVAGRRARRQLELAARNILMGQESGDINADRDPWILGAMMLGAINFVVSGYWQNGTDVEPKTLKKEIWAGIDALSRA